jgi:hypothetical protein
MTMSLRRRIGQFAEAYVTTTAGNWQVFNWPAVISTLLAHAHRQAELAAGSVVVGIDDLKIALRLTVDAQQAQCQETDDEPDISTDAATILRLLCGPLSLRAPNTMPVPACDDKSGYILF